MALAACGPGNAQVGSSGSGSGSSSGSSAGAGSASGSGSGSGSTSGHAGILACPLTPPANGSAPCAIVDRDSGAYSFPTCEYGGNQNGACTTTAQCLCDTCGGGAQNTDGSWQVTAPAAACGQNAAACPAAYGTGEGSACPDAGGTCDYPQGRCGCLSCWPADGGTMIGFWHCRAWDDPGIGANCPSKHPNIGTACSAPDPTICDYQACCGGPSLGPSVQCAGGVWQEYASGGCSCGIALCP